MLHNKERTAQPHSWHTSRHQETPKSVHASGTSGPIASRDDGAVFLTAAKNNQESVRRGFLLTLGWFLLKTQDVILFQHRVQRDEQTERVCAENASLIPIRHPTNIIHPREHGHTAPTPRHARTHVPTPARARAPTHARTSEDDHDRIVLIKNKGTTKKHKKSWNHPRNTTKTESEYRAQQQRGSSARYLQHARLRSACDGAK